MSSSLGLSSQLVSYLARANPPEHPVLARCREETHALPQAQMQISAEQGAFMQILARMLNAKRAFEVGVFTGYSALATALTLKDAHGPAAHLLACDVSEEWATRARHYWREAGVDDVIELKLAPAIETLDAQIAAGQAGTFDFGFIDADKAGYAAYYEAGLSLLRPGGMMVFDNVLWGGRVVDPADTSADTSALRALAAKVRADARVYAVMTNIGDGLLLCLKR